MYLYESFYAVSWIQLARVYWTVSFFLQSNVFPSTNFLTTFGYRPVKEDCCQKRSLQTAILTLFVQTFCCFSTNNADVLYAIRPVVTSRRSFCVWERPLLTSKHKNIANKANSRALASIPPPLPPHPPPRLSKRSFTKSSNLNERSQVLHTVRVVSLCCYLELLYGFRQTWTLQYRLKLTPLQAYIAAVFCSCL